MTANNTGFNTYQKVEVSYDHDLGVVTPRSFIMTIGVAGLFLIPISSAYLINTTSDNYLESSNYISSNQRSFYNSSFITKSLLPSDSSRIKRVRLVKSNTNKSPIINHEQFETFWG